MRLSRLFVAGLEGVLLSHRDLNRLRAVGKATGNCRAFFKKRWVENLCKIGDLMIGPEGRYNTDYALRVCVFKIPG
jgi:hypothetical protein